MLHRIKQGIKKTLTVTIGICGLYAVSPFLQDAFYMTIFANKDKRKDKSKSVLVIPFHRIIFTDQHSPKLPDIDFDKKTPKTQKKITMEVKDFVSLIHKAARDPNILGLYGTCGEDDGINVTGLAQLEEIRNAIKVYRESHRRHLEPNLKYENRDASCKCGVQCDENALQEKPCLFFSYSFNSVSSVNSQYYLASAFKEIALQKRGDLNMFGISSSNIFLKSALETYGMKFHVFKHGLYKNSPNMFTENTYTPEHYDNVNNLITSLQKHVLDNISKGRKDSKRVFFPELWEAILEHGTMTALNANEVGFIDSIAAVDPMESWSKSIMENDNPSQCSSGKVENKFITIAEYKKINDAEMKGERAIKYYKKILDVVQTFNWDSIKNEYTKQKNLFNEKIVILNVSGGIDKQSASKIINCIKRIKEDDDVKSVILRVDSPGGGAMESEVILSELSDLSQPVICSMSNVAASGGYYIASNCKKIFALPTTITGSIGVFGIKVDLTELASRNGVNVEHVSIMPSEIDYASSLSPFKPLSKEAGIVINRNIDNIYDRFKSVVSEGRKLSLDEVEDLAQGKIYSGEQAKEIGLVDNCGGGINAAIDYAQSNYTDSGNAVVEVWPPKSPGEIIKKLTGIGMEQKHDIIGSSIVMNHLNWLNPSSLNMLASKRSSGYSGALLVMDETSAVQHELKKIADSSVQ